MAKKKKTAKRRSTRRRRIGAIGGGDGLKLILGAAAGAIGGKLIASKLPASIDGKIKSAILIAGGFFLAGKAKNPLIKGVAVGMGATGAVALATDVLPAGTLGLISEIGGFSQYPNNPQLNAIAGFNVHPNNPQLNVIAGIPVNAAAAGIA